jgi:hypothetical protein
MSGEPSGASLTLTKWFFVDKTNNSSFPFPTFFVISVDSSSLWEEMGEKNELFSRFRCEK